MNPLALTCGFLFSLLLTGWAVGLVADKVMEKAATLTKVQISVANAAQRGAVPTLTAECQHLARLPGGPTAEQKAACLRQLDLSRR
jgi:hypothetical protein